MKRVVVCVLISFAIASCGNKKQLTNNSSVYTLSPLASSTLEATFVSPFSTVMNPKITATPISYDPLSQDVTKVIDTLFDNKSCSKEDYLTPVADIAPQYIPDYQVGTLQFIEITDQVDFSKVSVDEIADSISKHFRAYLVGEPKPTSSCSDCIQSRVYLENEADKRIYKIDWKDYLPSRVLARLVWVGDNVLTFFQSVGPHSDELIGINVEEQKFVYYAGLSCY